MTTQQQSKCRGSLTSRLITFAVIILFSCSHSALAQQRDGEEPAPASSGSSSTSGRVNFNIIQLLNGEYLEMFGAGGSQGILRGHPSVAAIELGSTSAHPLIFSTGGAERMRILANGFIGIGATNPITPFELHVPDATAYSVGVASNARMRLVNSNTTNNNAVELNLATIDSSGTVATGVRFAGIFTNHTAGAGSADLAIVLRNGGPWHEVMRFASGGNVGIGTNAPAYKLDVAGPIRSSSGGFVFPDGTVQTTAGGGGGGSQWVTSGTNIFYNGGNVGVGTSTPAVGLDVAQNKAVRIGQAYLSSGGNYVHLANNAWYNGGSWQFPGGVGALYQINGQSHVFYSHNGAGAFTSQLYLPGNGFVGIGTTNPTSRLHVDGGTIRLSSTAAGQTPFQLYSYLNSDSLWLASGNASKSEIHLTPGYAIDYDRSLAIQYTPGVTGAAGGQLNIGQMSRNAATFTHGSTVLFTNGLERLRINSAGNVGIGTATPSQRLDVQGGAINASGGLCIAGDCKTAWSQVGGGGSSQWTTAGANIHFATGNVGIGTTVAPVARLHVQGDARVTANLVVDGNIAAKYQDLAEWVPAAEQLAAGTVVILDTTKPNQVTSSNASYDTRVAGVISAQPGIVLGEKGDDKVLVATTGRVRVKVDATSGPIEIGDLLVTSEREGFAMKSMPVEIGGVRIHRPGTLIGKALERLAGGTGEILVLLSLQ